MNEHVTQTETPTTEQIELIVAELQKWLGMSAKLGKRRCHRPFFDLYTPTGVPFGSVEVCFVGGKWSVGACTTPDISGPMLSFERQMNGQTTQGGQQ